jgi:hypothetical protein
VSEETDELADRLESIAEELADLAMSRLREAIEAGGDPSGERRLTRARRSVEKAVALLRVVDEA